MDWTRWLAALTASSPILLFLALYGPAAGHGFVRDDYAWLVHSQVSGWQDLFRILGSDIGFYRPAVGLSFALNEWLFGWDSVGYGATNLLLAAACSWAVASLATSLGLARGAAAVAGAIWLLHPGFLPVSVLWISGRTALLMILGSTACAASLMRGRLWRALAWLVLALLSKEEAVLLPVVLLTWLLIIPSRPVRPLTWALAAGAVEGIYFLARAFAGATTPFDAPPYYQLTFDPAIVAANLLWYLLHASAPALIVILTAWLALRKGLPGFSAFRRSGSGSVVLFALLWVFGSLAITMWLPIRSRLYLALPAVGASIAASAYCAAWWNLGARLGRQRALVAGIGLVAALAPAHVRGAREWTARNDFAASVLSDLGALTAGLPERSPIVLADDRSDPRGNLASVFGTMANEASVVASGRLLEVWIEPAPPHAEVMGLRPPCVECAAMRLILVAGRLRPSPSP